MKYIVIAHTSDYHSRSKQYIESLLKYATEFKIRILCIDFVPIDKDDRIEYAYCTLKDLPSYRTGFPANRKFYVCLEGGDFLPYFEWNDDDIIIHTDSDMLLQRHFFTKELQMLDNLKHGEIGATIAANKLTMREEYWRLKPKGGYEYAKERFTGDWLKYMYCAGVITCRVSTYKELSDFYLNNIDLMIHLFDHHAAGQWLFNYALHNNFKLVDFGSEYHLGDWFFDVESSKYDGRLYFNDTMVLFNHTKFNGIWKS